MLSIAEIVKQYLRVEGYDGLANAELECGCGLDDLMPCGDMARTCCPAYSRILDSCEYVGDCGPGDKCYFVDLEAQSERR